MVTKRGMNVGFSWQVENIRSDNVIRALIAHRDWEVFYYGFRTLVVW